MGAVFNSLDGQWYFQSDLAHGGQLKMFPDGFKFVQPAHLGPLGMNSIGSSGGRVASGSPNAFADMTGGGFPAILHPNAAVIPLPDGRSVPVTLKGGSSPGVGGSKRPVVHIHSNITVNAKDPAAFHASKDRLLGA
jgi:hypothetical protein